MQFSDITEANGREISLGPRDPNALAARNNEAQGLGKGRHHVVPTVCHVLVDHPKSLIFHWVTSGPDKFLGDL